MSSWLHAHRHALAALTPLARRRAMHAACVECLLDPCVPHATSALEDGVGEAILTALTPTTATHLRMRALLRERLPLLNECFGREGQAMFYYASAACSLHASATDPRNPYACPTEALRCLEMVVLRTGNAFQGLRWREVDALVSAAIDDEARRLYL